MKKAIVFGGAGFLGSHIIDALARQGIQTSCYDLSSPLVQNSNVEYIKGDLLNLEMVCAVTKGCDYVYNCAALSDINEARNLPLLSANVNIIGNLNVLEACRTNNVKRFLFASSVYVYSENGGFYRVTKQASESFVETYQERYDLPFTILRYGSLYGRRSDERNGLYRILKQALTEKRVVYGGSPETLREYIHVTDAAELSVEALDPKHENSHLIITGAEKISISGLMRMIAEIIPGVTYEFSKQPMYGHYVTTPYTYSPKLGRKLVPSKYVDLGQGIIDCLSEIAEKRRPASETERRDLQC